MELAGRGRELVRRLADAAQRMQEEEEEEGEEEDGQPAYDVKTLLAEAKAQLDPSSPSGQELLDIIGIDLPSILVKFSVITHGSCKEFAEFLLKALLESCDPRDMFAAYMEALHLYSVSESLKLCPILLDGLSKIFTRLRRRKAEYFKESLPGLLKVAEVASDTKDTWRVLDKVVNIVLVLLDAALHEEVKGQRERLFETLGIFILLLLARFSEFEQLNCSSAAKPLMLQLARLLSTCCMTYVDLITGSFSERLTDFLTEDLVNEDGYITEAKQGAAIAVWWRFCFDKAAVDNQEAVNSIIGGLRSARHAFVSALSNVLVLLSSIEKTWKRVEMGIDLLAVILEWGTAASADNPNQIQLEFVEYHEYQKLYNLLEMVHNVVIFFPQSRTRKNAYSLLVNIVRNVLPAAERFKALKDLIIQCEHSSMVSLLLYVVKEEVDNAISSKRKAEGKPFTSPFASVEVLELIEFVLRPRIGGPPDLPSQIDAVLSALNLYRFLLIKEATGKSNYTGVLFNARLTEARSTWLQPLVTFLESFKRNMCVDDPQVSASILLSVSNIEGVLYRCLELVEAEMKEPSI